VIEDVRRTLKRWKVIVNEILPKQFVLKSQKIIHYTMECSYSRTITIMCCISFCTTNLHKDYFSRSSLSVLLPQAFHKAVLHIGEEGTKEGASPEVGSLDQQEVPPLHPVIRLDRAFLLMILEKRTRSVLFLGKLVNPTKQ
jgi:serine protease inhibitor